MKTKNVVVFTILFLFCLNGFGQGFINLNFESANVSNYSSPNYIPATNAIPGWSAYLDGSLQNSIFYDNATLGAAAVSLQGTNGVQPAIAGLFSVFLQGAIGGSSITPQTAAIEQTGLIPVTMQSLIFWGNTSLSGVTNNMQLAFNSSIIPYSAIGNGNGYTIYEADISSFAGQSGQLVFTAFGNTWAEIDNIQFSSTAVPEPSGLALAALGTLLLGFRRWRNSSQT